MKTLAKKIKNLKSGYADLELKVSGMEKKMKKSLRKLLVAGMLAALTLSGCSHVSLSEMQVDELRESYCESVRYEDETYCEYVPINPNVTIHYLPETDECRFFYADTGEEEVKNCFEEDMR
jgi:hypothetical protein